MIDPTSIQHRFIIDYKEVYRFTNWVAIGSFLIIEDWEMLFCAYMASSNDPALSMHVSTRATYAVLGRTA